MRNYLKWGTYNSICDVCGQKYKADELRTRWDGLEVCRFDFETRHPQDLIRIRPESSGVGGPVRPESTDTFLTFSYSLGYSVINDETINGFIING